MGNFQSGPVPKICDRPQQSPSPSLACSAVKVGSCAHAWPPYVQYGQRSLEFDIPNMDIHVLFKNSHNQYHNVGNESVVGNTQIKARKRHSGPRLRAISVQDYRAARWFGGFRVMKVMMTTMVWGWWWCSGDDILIMLNKEAVRIFPFLRAWRLHCATAMIDG